MGGWGWAWNHKIVAVLLLGSPKLFLLSCCWLFNWLILTLRPISGGGVFPYCHWMTIPKFWPKPIPRLFLRYQIFQNRPRDFFLRPNFSETDTFLPRPNLPKPKPRLFSETKFFQNRNRDFFTKPNFSKLKPKPSKIWQKSRDRDLNRDFSTSFEMKFGKFGTYKQNWNFWDQNLGL